MHPPKLADFHTFIFFLSMELHKCLEERKMRNFKYFSRSMNFQILFKTNLVVKDFSSPSF